LKVKTTDLPDDLALVDAEGGLRIVFGHHPFVAEDELDFGPVDREVLDGLGEETGERPAWGKNISEKVFMRNC